jgi:hypothetical protein
LGVLGLTAHSSEMSGEGVDMGQRVYVHHLTLTRPRGMRKDIGARALRVGPQEPSRADWCRLVPQAGTGPVRSPGTPNASSDTTH